MKNFLISLCVGILLIPALVFACPNNSQGSFTPIFNAGWVVGMNKSTAYYVLDNCVMSFWITIDGNGVSARKGATITGMPDGKNIAGLITFLIDSPNNGSTMSIASVVAEHGDNKLIVTGRDIPLYSGAALPLTLKGSYPVE